MKKMLRKIICAVLLTLLISACSDPTERAVPPEGGAASDADTSTVEESSQEEAASGSDNPFNIGTQFTQEEVNDYLRIDEHLYEQFLGLREEEAVIPALLQDYIPQGITMLEEQGWLVISHYSAEAGRPTILTVIDVSGEFIKAFELYHADGSAYTGHAGGITASKSYIWVASGGKVRRISIDDLVNGEQPKLTFGDEFTVDSRASFVYEHDGMLWVGDFAMGATYPTPETHYITNREGVEHKGWVAGYQLDETTEDIVSSEEAAPGQPARPDLILSIPDRVQGMAIVEDQVLLSTSYGRNNPSALLLFDNVLSDEPHTYLEDVYEEPVPVWFLDGVQQTGELVMPPASETLVSDGEKLYILFESGADKYRVSGSYPLLRIQTIRNDLLGTIAMPE